MVRNEFEDISLTEIKSPDEIVVRFLQHLDVAILVTLQIIPEKNGLTFIDEILVSITKLQNLFQILTQCRVQFEKVVNKELLYYRNIEGFILIRPLVRSIFSMVFLLRLIHREYQMEVLDECAETIQKIIDNVLSPDGVVKYEYKKISGQLIELQNIRKELQKSNTRAL